MITYILENAPSAEFAQSFSSAYDQARKDYLGWRGVLAESYQCICSTSGDKPAVFTYIGF
jgi:hypothetical protein